VIPKVANKIEKQLKVDIGSVEDFNVAIHY